MKRTDRCAPYKAGHVVPGAIQRRAKPRFTGSPAKTYVQAFSRAQSAPASAVPTVVAVSKVLTVVAVSEGSTVVAVSEGSTVVAVSEGSTVVAVSEESTVVVVSENPNVVLGPLATRQPAGQGAFPQSLGLEWRLRNS